MESKELYKRVLNKLGYFDYQQGLIERHLKQEGGWDSHLARCRNFILKAAEFYKPEKITVMGSGWLLDLPLAELLEITGSVTLTDIVHPPEVIRQVSSLSNVKLSTEDITGGLIENIWHETRKAPLFGKLKSLDGIEIPQFKFREDPGLLISLNIMSQLEVLPVRYLKTRTHAGEEELLKFRAAVQERHLELLHNHKSVLLTDTNEIFTDRSGGKTDVRSVVIDLPEGRMKEEWEWDFDLKYTDYYGKRSVMKVTAIML